MTAMPLTFAVPKGRILDEALPIMARAGVVPEDGFHDKGNRSLTFATSRDDMRLIRVRAFDVATFVAHGAAQLGIVGSDVIEEFDYAELYAPVDLDIGHCHLAVAEPKGGAAPADQASHLRDRASGYFDDADTAVREHPATAMGIAVGVGFALGLLLARR